MAVGLVSGFVRWADGIVMRIMDGMMSIPPILLAITLMALTRGSVGNVITAITIAEFPRVARLVRSGRPFRRLPSAEPARAPSPCGPPSAGRSRDRVATASSPS